MQTTPVSECDTPIIRPRSRSKKLLVAAVAALVVTGFAPMAPAGADDASDETSFVTQINAVRATQGLPGLTVDAGLTAKARAWAQTMADANRIWHSVLTDGVTADWRKLGENVGMGGSVDGLHVAFVKSIHHYENLVDPAFDSIGLGVVRSAEGTIFVAEEFMRTAVAPPARTPAPMPVPTPAPKPGPRPAPALPVTPVTVKRAVPASPATTVPSNATATPPARRAVPTSEAAPVRIQDRFRWGRVLSVLPASPSLCL